MTRTTRTTRPHPRTTAPSDAASRASETFETSESSDGTAPGTPAHDPRRWTEVLRPAARPGPRVVVFPHAGGGARRYREVLAPLPAEVEVVGVTLPGRERRAGLAPHTTPARAVAGIGAELRTPAAGRTVFYGHSLGALLALLTAHRAGVRCDALVVSCSLPGSRAFPRPGLLGTGAGLTAVLTRHGLAPDALEDASLPPARRALAHDLALAREALLAMDGVRVDVPLTALAGDQDPLVPLAALPLWARLTTGPFRSRRAEGGHFLPFTACGRAVLLEELVAPLQPSGHGADLSLTL
ncbi:alpha/beta fold hydrolase [Streptomyces sp. NPDC033538]|uniref:thioesterase II family protein n=1 Tax=Streptomyces sp. NPDC033538 TaxID=3155367 RepID=UPI003410A2C5